MGLEILHSRLQLLHLFKLCCLSVTTASPKYPLVVFGSINTSGLRGRLTGVVLPGQSNLPEILDSISFCCEDSQLAKFSLLTPGFGRTASAPDYVPWFSVDNFGWSFYLYISLMASYRAVIAGPKVATNQLDPVMTFTVADESFWKFLLNQRGKGREVTVRVFHLSPNNLLRVFPKTRLYMCIYVLYTVPLFISVCYNWNCLYASLIGHSISNPHISFDRDYLKCSHIYSKSCVSGTKKGR